MSEASPFWGVERGSLYWRTWPILEVCIYMWLCTEAAQTLVLTGNHSSPLSSSLSLLSLLFLLFTFSSLSSLFLFSLPLFSPILSSLSSLSPISSIFSLPSLSLSSPILSWFNACEQGEWQRRCESADRTAAALQEQLEAVRKEAQEDERIKERLMLDLQILTEELQVCRAEGEQDMVKMDRASSTISIVFFPPFFKR